MMRTVLWAVDGCPVCPGGGALVCVKARITMELIFFCPSCGVAWQEIPDSLDVGKTSRLTKLAPNGVVLPSQEELESAGWLKRLVILDNVHWLWDLESTLDHFNVNLKT